MPSMRPHPLNPRPPPLPIAPTAPFTPAPVVAPSLRAAAHPPVAQAAPAGALRAAVGQVDALPPGRDDDSAAERAARAAGFHESSYELQHGLQVSESEWPADLPVPDRLGER